MRRLVLVGMVVAWACAAAWAEDKKFDTEKLVGTWTYVSAESGGQKKDKDALKGQTVIFTKDKLTLKGEQGMFVLKYDVDAKKSPATINMEIVESPFGGGAKAAGIIELSGDDLKMCYNPESDKPPTKFEAKEGMTRFLVLKRAKQ